MANVTAIEELNKNLVDPLWNDRNIAVIRKCFSPNVDVRTTFITGKGPDILEKSALDLFAAFPVFKLSLDESIVTEGTFTYKWSAYAEHTGEILNIKPSGKGMIFHGIVLGTLDNGIITQYHSFSDIPQVLYSNLEHSHTDAFPAEAVLLDHENYEQGVSNLIFSIAKAADVRLSRRELECLYFWLKGYSIKETARQLGDISVKTVQVFRDKIKKKFNVLSYKALILLLQQKGVMSLFLS